MGMKSSTIAKIVQELADAWNLPKFHKITRENLYTEANIGVSWHEDFKFFEQSLFASDARYKQWNSTLFNWDGIVD
jgi:hypothetical protein